MYLFALYLVRGDVLKSGCFATSSGVETSGFKTNQRNTKTALLGGGEFACCLPLCSALEQEKK